jgi:hypothetical protein
MCTPLVEARFVDTATFEQWRQTTTDQLNALAANTMPTETEMASVISLQKDVSATTACIASKFNEVASASSDIFRLETQIAENEAVLVQRKKDIEVARDRALNQRYPERTKSYYDGWFPLTRPLKHLTIPILIGVSLFLLSLTFFYFMAWAGLDVRIAVRLPGDLDGTGAGGLSIPTPFYKSKPFWGMTVIAIVLLGLTIYGFRR